jgi:hypothetical protein
MRYNIGTFVSLNREYDYVDPQGTDRQIASGTVGVVKKIFQTAQAYLVNFPDDKNIAVLETWLDPA